ncbi:hypothetical protein [Rubripirellula obstinata]|nr:hypothetical protein [Rubripirellula obstinata]
MQTSSGSKDDKGPKDDKGSKDDKGLIAASVIAGLVMLGFLAANLPLKYVDRQREAEGAFHLSGSRIISDAEMPVMAGWPMRFMIQYPNDQVVRYFAWPPLVCNLLIALFVGSFAFWILRYREKKLSESSQQRRTQKYFDVLFATLIFLLPVLFLGASWLSSERQRRLFRNVDSKASVELSCWYPRLFADKVPSPLRRCFLKPRSIEFISAEPEETELVARLPELVGISFYRSEVPSGLFEQLSNHFHLTRLSLVRQSVTDRNVQSIASLRYVERLRISSCGLDDQLLDRFSHWDKLEYVNLSNNPIALSNFGQPAWSDSVTELTLPRPKNGTSGELTMKGWPKLTTLSVRRSSSETNGAVLSIQLSDLPELESLLLDRYQKHSLDLSSLPKLEGIDDFPDGQHRMSMRDIWIPGGCWVDSVRLMQLPRLSQCSFYLCELNNFEIDETLDCDLIEFSCELVASSGWIRKKVTCDSNFQSLIDSMGKTAGPKSLVFHSTPLTNLDLSPLINNTAIERLQFNGCGIMADQVNPKSPKGHLAELNLGDCVLGENQLRRLMADFPNLEVLRASGMALKEVNLVEPNRLEILELDRLESIQSLRLVDQHRLSTNLKFSESPDTLIIQNSESLFGIVVEKPLKSGAAISGLRNLEWFAAGGPEVSDQIVQQVLMCPDLDRLTLAYPNLSKSMLRQIGQAKHLTALIIPGAGVDQEITDAWHPLKSLWEINLDESEIGGRTIQWLSRNESLRSVSLARAKIDSLGLNSLHSLNRVIDLSLAGVALAYSDIAKLLTEGSLECLDLSGCQIDDQMLQGLGNAKTLLSVKLHGCQVSESQVNALKEAKPDLRVVTDDEPMRRLQLASTEMDGVEPAIGMRAWRDSETNRNRKRRRASVFNTGTAPSVGDTLDLDHFRG